MPSSAQTITPIQTPRTTAAGDGAHTAKDRSGWELSAGDRSLAARYVDADMWVGRLWLDNGSDPFDLRRALGLAASTPF